MNNERVGKKGQKLVEDYYKNNGWEVDPVWRYDNLLPYDIRIRQTNREWIKLQVKATRRLKKHRTVFYARKSSKGRKVGYEKRDLDFFVFVDNRSQTMVVRPFVERVSFSFQKDQWQVECVRCPR